MAAGLGGSDFEHRHTDRCPLLMDNSSMSNQEHVVTITPGSQPGQIERGGLYRGSSSAPTLSTSNAQGDDAISLGSLARSLSTPLTSQGQSAPVTTSMGGLVLFGRHGDGNSHGAHQRASPLNSRLWISIELTITVSQIIASIIVLALSRDEKPRAPLRVWVLGYATGCLATLPLLYWRYTHRYAQQQDQGSVPSSRNPPSSSLASPHASFASSIPTSALDEEAEGELSSVRDSESSSNGHARMSIFVERFKLALDCFFAVWFVVGNVWIFGGHSSSSEAANLYRLCIVFLTFSCIGYAMPFILCSTICCCLPCIITLLGFREDQGQVKGASREVIEGLPIYKFKVKGTNKGKGSKDGNDSDFEGSEEGGFVAAGTENERAISAEDAVCCICLGKYKDDAELRELPCTHFFHVECVDKWLKINASCPLCKRELRPSGQAEQSATDAGEQRDQ